ncbi:MFS general substrate transporter [Aaosphaeria arxii CBS 175.79]|uniref:MFS general substrate transporter n=1 Tax=Aaosphaeria arxii CBS 175.79 TaxID=1450172 RepID=A0A6A5XYT7_9PLEO|nr:MFS general substrate transporter [Aaosphaeria arxii CBS 175.79]KAF2017871.1 MFS general substrate transporter [Aaosphaeria arxii CBS 175.79]
MASSRYKVSRQRSCGHCMKAKRKCQGGPGTCVRCVKRGLDCTYFSENPQSQASTRFSTDDPHRIDTLPGCTTISPDAQASVSLSPPTELLDFSNLDIYCPIDANDIKNRWLNTFIPIPGQKVKEYPSSISAFIVRILESYVGITTSGRGYPPFVHHSQIEAASMKPLITCLKVVRICRDPHQTSEHSTIEVLRSEMDKLAGCYTDLDGIELLAAFQSYLIYTMVILFKYPENSRPFLRETMVHLQELACLSSQEGLLCKKENTGSRPRWEEWLVVEAKRRTLFTMYLVDSVLSSQDGQPTFLGTELRGLPASGDRFLWKATSRIEWERFYDVHLADWNGEGLRIDELWPVPEDLEDSGIQERRRRVNLWLETVDEFGTALFTVTSITHGNMIAFSQPSNPNIIIMSSENFPGDSSNAIPNQHIAKEPYSIFDRAQKALIVIIVATAATFSGFASNIYFPAIPNIARDLDVSIDLINLTVTSYLIFQGLAPSLWGPISDVKGRRVAYTCTFLVFLGACIALAETKNLATLIVFRCLQSTGSASTIAIGSGVIGDITTRDERGGYMGIFQAGLLAPVAIGPIIGGALAASLGWRAIFWFLAIYSGVFLIILFAFLPETLRSIVGNGSRHPSTFSARFPLSVFQKTTKVKWDRNPSSPETMEKKPIDITGPLRILFSKQALPIILFLAIHYAVWQMSITAMSPLFEQHYGLSESEIGLTFIANGVGSIIGTLTTGKMLDIDYRRVKTRYEERITQNIETGDANELASSEVQEKFPLEEARLRLVPVFSVIQFISVLIFGWTIQYSDHITFAAPIITTFVTGWTAVSTQSIIMTYLVDAFPDRSAAASASINLARCLLAAGGTSFVMPLINHSSVAIAFTACSVVQVVSLIGLGLQRRFGMKWRTESSTAH